MTTLSDAYARKRGHQLASPNLYPRRDGRRECFTCKAAANDHRKALRLVGAL